MNENKREIVVDGIKVEGEIINRYSRHFKIKITSPFMTLTGASNIPYFAAPYRTFDGEYGDQRIEEKLVSLYYMGKFLVKNMEKLKKEYQIVRKELKGMEEKGLTEDKFKVKRLDLRREMKKGEITSKQYQKLLTPLRKEYEELDSKIRSTKRTFFDDNFPMRVPIDTDREVLDIIEDRKKIKKEN